MLRPYKTGMCSAPTPPSIDIKIIQGLACRLEDCIAHDFNRAACSPALIWADGIPGYQAAIEFLNWVIDLQGIIPDSPEVYKRNHMRSSPSLVVYRRCTKAHTLGVRYEAAGFGSGREMYYFTYPLPYNIEGLMLCPGDLMVDVVPRSSRGDELNVGDRVIPSLHKKIPSGQESDYYFISRRINGRHRICQVQAPEENGFLLYPDSNLTKIPREEPVRLTIDFFAELIKPVKAMKADIIRLHEWACLDVKQGGGPYDIASLQQLLHILDGAEKC